ncbi:hypothetical protein ACKGJY_09290 [Hyunsoonleella sp. 2307UL5-6]|uniref:hypothetical protein n=1 Tax=Hyunsoonleella sp. 2307UL5-6 TaxID=3384768 RepID=UPI0039BC5FCA
MKSKQFIYVIMISIGLFSCSTNSTEDVMAEEETIEDPQDTGNITYNEDISALMTTHCTRCHGQPLANGAPFPLLDFSQTSSRVNRIISRTNNVNNPMPPSGLIPVADRALIQQWLDDGLLEN